MTKPKEMSAKTSFNEDTRFAFLGIKMLNYPSQKIKTHRSGSSILVFYRIDCKTGNSPTLLTFPWDMEYVMIKQYNKW